MDILSAFKVKTWDIFNSNGSSILTFQTFISIDVKAETKVLEQPVEQAGFFTYNKIHTPTEVSITLGITDKNFQKSLDVLNQICDKPEIISVSTPHGLIENQTLTSYAYSIKRETGINTVYVDLNLRQVQFTPTASGISIGNARNSGNVSKVSLGQVQAGEPSQSVLSKLIG